MHRVQLADQDVIIDLFDDYYRLADQDVIIDLVDDYYRLLLFVWKPVRETMLVRQSFCPLYNMLWFIGCRLARD